MMQNAALGTWINSVPDVNIKVIRKIQYVFPNHHSSYHNHHIIIYHVNYIHFLSFCILLTLIFWYHQVNNVKIKGREVDCNSSPACRLSIAECYIENGLQKKKTKKINQSLFWGSKAWKSKTLLKRNIKRLWKNVHINI